MRRFSELGIKQVDDKKIFNCQQVSISDVINCEIEVLDFIPNMKTTHGDNRYLVKFRQDGQEGKFFHQLVGHQKCARPDSERRISIPDDHSEYQAGQ